MAKNETKEKFDALSENPNASKKRMLKKVGVWCAAGVLVAGIALGTGFGIGCNATYTVTLNSDTENAQLTGAGKYKKGKEVTISAKDMAGYKFDHWEYKGNKVSDKTQYTFKLTKDTKGEYKAVYTETINLAPSPDNNKVSVDPSQIPNGTMITLTAEDRVGYTFKCWKLNGVEVSNQQSYTFTMSTDTAGEYTAEYTINSYTVSVTSGLESAVLTGANTYEYNSTVTVTASDVTGYLFDHWDLDGNNVSSEKSYTFTLSKANNYTLKAVYVNAYNITLTSNIPHATLTVSGEYKVGEKVTISASDVEGYTFNHWELGGTQVSTDKTYTFTMSESTKGEYVAVYTINSYEVTLTSNLPTGVGTDTTLTGAGSFDYKTKVTITANDVTGYVFKRWTFNGVEVSTDKSYTFTMLESTKGEYKAEYEAMITLTLDVDGVATPYTIEKGTTLSSVLSNIKDGEIQKYTLENTCGFYSNTGLTDFVSLDTQLTDSSTIYTKVATLDKITVTDGAVAMKDNTISGEVVIPYMYNGTKITSVTTAGFYNCSYLLSVVIPEGITSLGTHTFYDCVNLTNVVISKGVTQIGDSTFYNCRNLVDIRIPEGVTSIGNNAFHHCFGITNITIPATVTNLSNSSFDFYNLTNIDVVSGNKVYDSRENCNAIIETETNTLLYGCNNSTIPYGVTSIFSHAFASCLELSNITIPESVTSIGQCAFMDCSNLSNVIISDGVTSIGDEAFHRCTNLTSIIIPNSVTSIGESAFKECENLTDVTLSSTLSTIESEVFYACSSLINIVIPNGITSIRSGAFDGCSKLTSINIPSNVTKIDDQAFSGCTSLTSVIFEDTNGWYYADKSSATSGTDIDVIDATTNATNLKGTLKSKYWFKKDSTESV